MKEKRKLLLILYPAIIVLIFDQITKLAVVRFIKLYNSINVVPGFFNLVHFRNKGMAFGLFNDSGNPLVFYALLGASIIGIVLITIWGFKSLGQSKLMVISLALILGGTSGNLIDRIRYGEVIDFLDVYIGKFHWPAFNLADSSITTGAFLLAFSLVFGSREK